MSSITARNIIILAHLLLSWTHTPTSNSQHVICSCGKRWPINPQRKMVR